MPSKKLTAQKRDELKKKKQKQQQKKSSGFPSFIVLFVIIIVGIVAVIFVLSNLSDQEINGQTTSTLTAVQDFYVVPNKAYFYRFEVLNNDISKKNSEINITKIDPPFSGEAEIMDGFTIKYVPDINFSGYDELQYTISDGESESSSAVSIWVADENPCALIDTTMGTIIVELFEEKVPITARNFMNLAYQGYYDGTIFHRVIKEFMIQGGDPTGTGMGGHAAEYHEGYGDPDDPETWVIPDEFHDELKHNLAGILSMANSGPNTGSSQFFITVNRTEWLDGKHAIFGRVVMGIDTVVEISEVKTDSSDRPYTNVIINSIIIENDFNPV
jgi:peptidyl-prolyl cis-trans isomerase A (cyclophilin A)